MKLLWWYIFTYGKVWFADNNLIFYMLKSSRFVCPISYLYITLNIHVVDRFWWNFWKLLFIYNACQLSNFIEWIDRIIGRTQGILVQLRNGSEAITYIISKESYQTPLVNNFPKEYRIPSGHPFIFLWILIPASCSFIHLSVLQSMPV